MSMFVIQSCRANHSVGRSFEVRVWWIGANIRALLNSFVNIFSSFELPLSLYFSACGIQRKKKSIYLPVSCTAFLVVSVCVLLKSMCGVYRSDVRTWASTAPPLWLQDLRRKLKRSTLACTPEFFSFNAKVRRGSYHVTLRSNVGSPLVQQGFRFRHVAGISFAFLLACVKRMYEYTASERALWACSKSVRSLARML